MTFVFVCTGPEFLHTGVYNGFVVAEMFHEIFKNLMHGVSMKSDVDKYRNCIIEWLVQ